MIYFYKKKTLGVETVKSVDIESALHQIKKKIKGYEEDAEIMGKTLKVEILDIQEV